MNSHNRRFLLLATAAALPAVPVSAETAAETSGSPALEAIIVTGSKEKAAETGGSATYLDQADLDRHSYDDVNRVLRNVPGVQVREEDGFGLRPNIAMRGSYDDRNSKIAIYEDGVPVAPAPYAAPAAYYFPSIGRMSGVEVVKGASAIKYGPHTAAGAVHLVSTPIPDEVGAISGKGRVVYGSRDTVRGHLALGGWADIGGSQIGAMAETYQSRADGFKALDNGGPTGFTSEDYVVKLGWRTAEGAATPQALELRYSRYDQGSDETYLGLTQSDFVQTPRRRYAGSQVDRIDVSQEMWQLSHRIDFGAVQLSTVGYITETSRVWYKLQDVFNAEGQARSLSAVLQSPTLAANASALGYLRGGDSPAGALRVRSNDRLYKTKGVQSVLSSGFALGASRHELELSVRYHEDSEDRFQRDDRYTMTGGEMVLSAAGPEGAQANQIDAAKAWSFYLRDSITLGDLTLVPGLRYETIDLSRTRFNRDADTAGRATRGAVRDVSDNSVDIWIPGISLTYRATDALSLIAGVHRGFTNPPPVNAGGTLSAPERSTNWEAGLRYDDGKTSLSAIGFFNNYSNFVGTCTASSGSDCTIGDQFSGGRVHAKGIEIGLQHDAGAALGDGWRMPLGLVYTLTHGTFRTSLDSFGPWGDNVVSGDRLPNLPRHALNVSAGIGRDGWSLNASANYVSKSFAAAGAAAIADPYNLVEARWLVDLAAEFELIEQVSLFASIENLFDETYNVGNLPSGWRPGAPRTVLGGVKFGF